MPAQGATDDGNHFAERLAKQTDLITQGVCENWLRGRTMGDFDVGDDKAKLMVRSDNVCPVMIDRYRMPVRCPQPAMCLRVSSLRSSGVLVSS